MIACPAGALCVLVLYTIPWQLLSRVAWVKKTHCPYEADVELPAQDVQAGGIQVVLASDGGYSQGMLGTMKSLVLNLPDGGAGCTIHLVASRAGLSDTASVAECFRRDLPPAFPAPAVLLHELVPMPLDLEGFGAAHVTDPRFHKPEVFARFYLHKYVPTRARVLWLDSDLIVRSDVSPLYAMQLTSGLAAKRAGHYTFASYSERYEGSPLQVFFKDILDVPVFNTGVLLYDLERWRASNLVSELEGWTATFAGGVDGDQLMLNLAFRGRFDTLHWRWNLPGLGQPAWNWIIRDWCDVKSARILHFSGHWKPWIRLPGARHLFAEYFEPYEAGRACEALPLHRRRS